MPVIHLRAGHQQPRPDRRLHLDDPVTLAGARGFLLAKGVGGPFIPVDVPGAPRNLVRGLNDRGQLVGSYENTNNGQQTRSGSEPAPQLRSG
jgi:hypothetical protein